MPYDINPYIKRTSVSLLNIPRFSLAEIQKVGPTARREQLGTRYSSHSMFQNVHGFPARDFAFNALSSHFMQRFCVQYEKITRSTMNLLART